MKIEIKNATEEYAPLAARVFLTALNLDFDENKAFLNVCLRKDTLYSWSRMRVLFFDGKPVGGMIAYDWKKYSELRDKTWKLCRFFDQAIESIAQECYPGEYYIDSLAVLPEYRGLGFGRILLCDGILLAKANGCSTTSLLADKSKTNLISFYESIGFIKSGSMNFLGDEYWRMCYSP